jgi:hypothetical protein
MNNQMNSYHINIITLFTVGLGTPLASINAFSARIRRRGEG